MLQCHHARPHPLPIAPTARRSDGTMFAWILILSFFVALFLVILHDATKDDSDGSAIMIAAKKIKVFAFWATLKARKLLASGVNMQAHAPPPKKKWWSKDHRVSMTPAELESAISEAVKKTAPGCKDFVAVIVQHRTPKSHLDPNWAIRGVRYGRADKPVADEALATVIERMQREFLLTEED